ncbi:MAG TPA: hypothetical protein VFT99_11850 [Roseiflexaceae bacterium]|nr:hypothetical protein [Roseiflexaceae bacterium]
MTYATDTEQDARATGQFRRVDWFYSDALTNDPEGCLVVLCEACANQHEAEIDGYAQDGDGNDTCELCGRKAL